MVNQACCVKARIKAVIFKMSSVSCNADSQSLVSFLDCTVNHSVIKTVPLLLDTLMLLFHILDLVPVNVVPRNPPHRIMNRILISTVGWTQQGWNEVCLCFDAAILLDH